MNPEEMQKKTAEKIQAISTLCKQLEVTITAEQMVTENGIIKTVVFYHDEEKYEVDKEEIKEPKKNDSPNLRKKND
jgi:hypothetical protein